MDKLEQLKQEIKKHVAEHIAEVEEKHWSDEDYCSGMTTAFEEILAIIKKYENPPKVVFGCKNIKLEHV